MLFEISESIKTDLMPTIKFFIAEIGEGANYLRKDGVVCCKMALNGDDGGTYFDTREEAQKCLDRFNAAHIMVVQAHCSDLCNITFPNGKEHDGYVPDNIGIGGRDDVYLRIDVNSGRIIGWNDEIRDKILSWGGSGGKAT